MNQEETINVEEIKEEVKQEIPVEEETTPKPEADVVEELRSLGRQFADTLRAAWNSRERVQLEGEIREGVDSFVDEVEKMMREAKEMPAVQKARDEVSGVVTKVETGEVTRKARVAMAQGLKWFSVELERLADQFTPPEKASTSADTGDAAAAEEPGSPVG